jgi:predicted nucleic acid-binding protein
VAFLLDTNILSELRKPRPDPGVHTWFGTSHADDLYLSVLTVGEIRQGVERLQRRDPAQARAYLRWLETLKRDFAARVLPVTTAVAEEWGRLNARRSLPVIDGLLAATALVHRLTLVTRNVADVERTGAEVLNPFASVAR